MLAQKLAETANLFREREVDNLQNLIYSNDSTDYSEEGLDTFRYDTHPSKLEWFLRPTSKRLLKKKFVTG